MKAMIRGITYHLAEGMLTNEQLAAENPQWPMEMILEKTGIRNRCISKPQECASDLGVGACQKLFNSGICQPSDIDFLLLCTQSPDHFLPTTACLMQNRLGIPTRAGALDFNLGCSGYIFGLGLAKGLVETNQAHNVLLVTAETYSKFINPKDRSVRPLFGDAASATLISLGDGAEIGPFIYGTDGGGGDNLIVPSGGMRIPQTPETGLPTVDDRGNVRTKNNLYMNGPELCLFTLKSIPSLVAQTLEKASLGMDDIDFFVFHQASHYILENLRNRIKIPNSKFLTSYENYGNTVSSTIPIVLCDKIKEGIIQTGHRIMLVGFGVGYSWGATIVEW